MKRGLVGIVMLLLLMLPVAGIVAEKKMKWDPNANVIYGDGIVIMFHDRRPKYHIWIPNKNKTAVYIINFNRIIEFVDIDNNGKYNDAHDRIISIAPLTAHDVWQVSSSERTLEDGTHELIIIFKGIVEVKPSSRYSEKRVVNVTFVNHIYDRDVEIEGYTLAGGRELKIDIIIEHWPWFEENSKLALEIVFAGMFHGKWGSPKCESKKIELKNANMYTVRLQGDADYYCEFKFQDRAKIKNESGEHICKLNSSENFKANSAVMYIVYPHFNGTLIHDPSITVESSGFSFLETVKMLLPPIIVVFVVVIVLAIIIKHRK